MAVIPTYECFAALLPPQSLKPVCSELNRHQAQTICLGRDELNG